MSFISRRDLLKRAGALGAFVSVDGVARPFQGRDGGPERPALQPARAPLENFTAAEFDTLDAIVARLIPSDELGPGAKEAHTSVYIDRAIGGALASSRQAYTAGLAALDRYAQSSRGAA